MPYLEARHRGATGVLFCTGPTLEHYIAGRGGAGRGGAGRGGDHRHRQRYGHRAFDGLRKRVVTFGVNSIVLVSALKMDYVFVQDRGRPHGDTGYLSNRAAMNAYVPGQHKFFGHFPGKRSFGLNGQHAKAANASRYQASNALSGCDRTGVPLVADVGNYAFGGSCSTAFSALQFALYTGVEDLFLVGCDVHGGYSASAAAADVSAAKVPEHGRRIRDGWVRARDFVARHYPCVSVTVVRPVGLRGVGFGELEDDPDY